MAEQPESKGGAADVGPGGPTESQPGQPSARHDAQLILGQVHGALHTAVENAPRWCPRDQLEAVRSAHDEVSRRFGATQADLNTGIYDERLESAGLSGMQAVPKKGGFRSGLARFYRAVADRAADLIGPLKSTLRWSHTYLSSLASVIPGAEAIGEFVEVVQNAIEDYEATDVNETRQDSRRSK